MYLHEIYASTDGYSDSTLLAILARCNKYKASTLLIESNFGDGMISELFRKHAINKHVPINIEETRANVRKEDRIIDSLEPVFNQHRLVIDPRVIKWDYDSGSERPTETRFQYMLGYQISRMCREKGAVKHDDRIDALAQGVKWFTDALSISADSVKLDRQKQEWQDHLQAWMDDPQSEANYLAMGMDFKQRQQARGTAKNGVPTWV
jgi:hypothetical protein